MKIDPTDTEKSDHIGIKIASEAKTELQRVAIDRSEPGDTVTMSEVAREAIEKYLAEIEETQNV